MGSFTKSQNFMGVGQDLMGSMAALRLGLSRWDSPLRVRQYSLVGTGLCWWCRILKRNTGLHFEQNKVRARIYGLPRVRFDLATPLTLVCDNNNEKKNK